MGTKKDPVDVAANIRRSIEVSQKGSRRVRCHTLRELFGFQAWSAQRKEIISRVLADLGVAVQPALSDAGPDDWVTLSLPELPEPRDDQPDPRPSAEWFDHLMTIPLTTEREVEMHFASPLFHGLGYDDDQEAAGFRFETYAGVQFRIAEADLVYFTSKSHSVTDGTAHLGRGQGLQPASRRRHWAGKELCLLGQALLLRHHQRRHADRVQLPGRSGPGREGAGNQALGTTGPIR